MRTLRVALLQVNPAVGDLTGNAAMIRDHLRAAGDAGADLALFPELCLTGYPPEDLVLKPAFVADNLAALEAVAGDAGDTAAVIGFVDRDERGLYNAAAVVAGGAIRAVYRKVLLPNYGVFDEKRTFVPGDRFPLVEIAGVRVGISICEDAWVRDGPVRTLARRGAEVIANINASPYHAGKGAERAGLCRSRAVENGVHFLYVQTVGGQDELVFDGDSLAVGPDGEILARGAQFEEDRILLDLSLPDAASGAASQAEIVRLAAGPPPERSPLPERAERPRMEPAEEIYAALVTGTRDYVRKNGFRQAVVGLSGGIDSSLTATVAADAIGADNVLGVAMPSEISSPSSLEDAKELAGNLGIEFRVVPIAAAHSAFLDTLSEAFAGTEASVAEENLQARIRGTILMALSNKFGHLVLATGNKSELAAGYSTLYGDMAGGFSVLKDVPKTTVFELARWRNRRGAAVIPERVLTKAPTAELRPGQLDTDALPPYEVLDPIIRLYVEEQRSIAEIVRDGHDRATVERVVEMIDRSEYKRRQAAPGVKITPHAFGKDRRIPITNAYREHTSDGRPRRRT